MHEGYPDLRADERTTLTQVLDGHRRAVLDALDRAAALGGDEAAQQRVLPHTDLTVAGIVCHLTRMEDLWFSHKLAGRPVGEPFASAPLDTEPDWDFHTGALASCEELRAAYLAACERSIAIVATYDDLSALATLPSFGKGPVGLRWLLVHMIEETAEHSGHLDLLLDALRGRAEGPRPL